MGHLFETTTFDMLTTAAALWMLIRALESDPQRWAPWIGFGVLTGVAMEIKVLAVLVMACCLLGILILGPRAPSDDRSNHGSRSVIAAALAAPNLIWQAAHGWPQLTHRRRHRQRRIGFVHLPGGLIPVTVLEIGPDHVHRADHRRGAPAARAVADEPLRWLAAGFLIFLVVMLVSGGKAYYPAAFYPALMAAGAGPVLDWARTRAAPNPVRPSGGRLDHRHRQPHPAGVSRRLAGFKIGMGPNPDMGETVGWSGYIRTVGTVAAAIPAGQLRTRSCWRPTTARRRAVPRPARRPPRHRPPAGVLR